MRISTRMLNSAALTFKVTLLFVLVLSGANVFAQTTFNFETGSSVTSPAGGWTNPGVGTYYRSTSTTALTLADLATACNGYTKYNTSGSSVIFFQPSADITAISVSGTGTGANRVYSSIATSSTIGGTYTNIAGASGSGGIGTGSAANCGTISITNLGTVTAGTFIRITFSGNVNTTRIDITLATITTPSTQASNIVFSNVGQTSMTLGWTRGNGSNVAVFVKDGAGAISNPADGSTYTANTVFGSGTQLGSSGYYCVYNGNGNTVDISGLQTSHTYFVQAFEYNGSGANTKYLTTTATNNPNSQATLAPGSDYRSATSGNWNSIATWEVYNGSAWVPASATPSNTDGAVTIQTGHVVTATANVSVDELTVNSGGEIDVNTGVTFTVVNGTGTDITLSGTVKNTGTFTLGASATMTVSATGIYEDAQPATTGTITIPAATWSAGSTFKLTGLVGTAGVNPTDYNSLQGTNQTFSNFIIDVPNLIGKLVVTRNAAGVFAVNGTLTVNSTGTSAYGAQLTSSGNQESLTVGTYVQNGGIVSILHNSSNTTAKNMTVTGNFTLTGTSVFNISAYTTGAGVTTLNIGGNISVAPTALVQRNTIFGTGGTTNMVFNGSSLQNVTLVTSGAINYTINNATGILLGSDLNASGSLTFTAGNISTGSNKVVIAATGSMVNAGTNGWVAGNLQKNVATGATSKIFETGDANGYRPVVVAFGNVTTAGDLTASVSQSAGDHASIATSGLDAGKTVNRYWTLTNSGIVFDQYDVTFTFLAADVDAGANTAAFIIKKYNGSAWSATTAGTRTAATTQATGLTSFSDFAIGEAASAGAPPTVSTQPNSGSVCTGSNTSFTSASLSSPAPTVQWERSTNGLAWVAIDGTLDGGIYSTFTSGTLNITGATAAINGYQYRAVFTNVNGSVNSNPATITVDPASVGGTAAGNQSVCTGTSPATSLTLSGHTGNVVKWQKASDAIFTTPVDIAASASSTLTGATIGTLPATTYFRAVVTSGACAAANSSVVTITVDPASNAGTLNGDQTICVGNAPANIIASGITGAVVRWESANSAAFSTASTISNTTTTLNPGALNATTYFRIVVKSGSCNEIASTTPVQVTVNTALQNSMALAGVSGGAEVCNSHDVSASANYFNNCDVIATVTPAGATPVTGSVNVCVKADAAVNLTYVPRTYIVTATAGNTANVTLYFLQSEFNTYNAASSLGDLPLNGSDAAGKANLRISVFPTASHVPGGLGEALYDPNDGDIVFNSPANRWEVTLPFTFVTANSSFFVHTSHWPLPVSFLDFKGELSGSSNKLTWSTATENNNKGFEVERSADGKNYSSIGFVASKGENGNSASATTYQLNDERPFAGNSYYRLKQTDKDGKFAYSKVVMLVRKTDAISIGAVYPNPSERSVNVIINSPKTTRVTVLIADLSGKTIMQRSSDVVAGANQQTIGIEQLSAGSYVIRVICDNGCAAAVHRFVKQ